MKKNIFKYISIILLFISIGFAIKYTINYASNLWIKDAIGYMPEPVIYHWSIWVAISCFVMSMISLAVQAKISSWHNKY
jgi:hypothetical protein